MTAKAIVIIDVESTCWRGNPPPGEQSEIIEIGVCLFDTATSEISDGRSMLVRPQRSKVSEFCTELTTLTPEQVAGGILFDEACAALQRDYLTRERLWGSWGNYDRKMFETQCASFGVEYPFGTQHVNLKALFGDLANRQKQLGMARALEVAGLPLEGTHHRGGDDAHNIARLLGWMLDKYGQGILDPYW